MSDEYCWDDGYGDRWEPDDFEEYNRNEADDYRNELVEYEAVELPTEAMYINWAEHNAHADQLRQDGDDGGYSDPYEDDPGPLAGETCDDCHRLLGECVCGDPGPLPEDGCPDCHEDPDNCTCEHDRLVNEIDRMLQGDRMPSSGLVAEATFVGAIYTIDAGLVIEITLANGKNYRVRVEEVKPWTNASSS